MMIEFHKYTFFLYNYIRILNKMRLKFETSPNLFMLKNYINNKIIIRTNDFFFNKVKLSPNVLVYYF